ncbi:MAG: DUF4998 domain-containing protein [Dysgonamonadaceae bacterium]|jgi:hypothetical protein|nr:DUF4998 domain-containing protein [Dysgonamonadaceae bacterium]
MKAIINYFLPFCLLVCFFACDDVNSLHQKYLDRGEILYTGKVDSVQAFAGNEKVKFTWQINSDTRIKRTVIYWDNKKNKVEIPVNRTQSGALQQETVINIAEGVVIFELLTTDDDGNRSLSVERTVQVYGPKYIVNYLRNRSLSFSFKNNTLTVDWQIAESSTIQYTTVQYTDYSTGSAEPKSVRIANDDMQTTINGILVNDKFRVITTFLPEGGLETLDALPDEYVVAAHD